MKMSPEIHQRGFTLVEVMVALIIAAFLLPALLLGFNQQADGISYLRDKSVAQWVASNKMAETRIEVRRSGRLFKGKRNGDVEMMGRDWYWWQESEATEVEDFYRVEVRVGDKENEGVQTLFTLVGFIASASGEANDG